MKPLEQRYAQHTQLSLGGGLERKTGLYINQICTLQDMLREMILANLR